MSESLPAPGPAGAATGGPALDLAAARPLFVHSSWRTASTWLWAKLRAAPTTIAYCEVFHEGFASIDLEQLRRTDYGTWNSKHPEGAPYFLEFSPFVTPERRAARGYDRRMAFEWFVSPDGLGGPLRDAERSYLEALIVSATERGKVPVLTDTRTLGRFAAIAAAFPGRHVLLVRNLFHQWASYSEQWAQGNGYFLDRLFATAEASRVDPFARMLCDWFDVGDRSPSNPATFQLFLLFHLRLYLHAFDAADLVVDANRLAADPDHRAAVEAALGAAVGAPIDLSDARAPFGLSLFAVGSKAAFVDTIEQFFKLAIDGSVSAEAVAFAARAKDEALLEWQRCEFYSGAARSWFGDKLKRAEAARSPEVAAPAPEAAAAEAAPAAPEHAAPPETAPAAPEPEGAPAAEAPAPEKAAAEGAAEAADQSGGASQEAALRAMPAD